MLLKILIVITSFTLAASATYSGQFVKASPSMFLQLTHPVATSSSYITVATTFTPLLSEALLVVRTTPFTPSTSGVDWQHLMAKSTTAYDYEGLVTSRFQYAWINNPGSGTTIYFYLINLSTTQRPLYSVTATETNFIARICTTGATFYASTFYCQSCLSGLTGAFCTFGFSRISQGETQSINLISGDYALVTVQTSSNAEISVKSSAGGVSVYFQYNNRGFEQHAGVVNHIDSGVYQFTSSGQFVAHLNNGGSSVAVGFINTNPFSVNVSIQYAQESGSSLMLILIGVIGGLLFLGIVITIVYIIKRSRNQRVVHPNMVARAPRSLRRDTADNTLSQAQINQYFPTTQLAELFASASLAMISNMGQQTAPEYECVICLCQIKPEEPIRVGYCRHIFHDACLLQWFQKQQNCPYCRQDYSKKGSKEAYDSLRKENDRDLKGAEIPQAIFRPRLNGTLQTLVIEDIEQQLK